MSQKRPERKLYVPPGRRTKAKTFKTTGVPKPAKDFSDYEALPLEVMVSYRLSQSSMNEEIKNLILPGSSLKKDEEGPTDQTFYAMPLLDELEEFCPIKFYDSSQLLGEFNDNIGRGFVLRIGGGHVLLFKWLKNQDNSSTIKDQLNYHLPFIKHLSRMLTIPGEGLNLSHIFDKSALPMATSRDCFIKKLESLLKTELEECPKTKAEDDLISELMSNVDMDSSDQSTNEDVDQFEVEEQEPESNRQLHQVSQVSIEAPQQPPKKDRDEHLEEVEIMRKTQENMNRKARLIMNYVAEPKSNLTEDLNDWEDLFDDDGKLQEDLVENICNEKPPAPPPIPLAIQHEPEPFDDVKCDESVEHIVEVYDFPANFRTQDIIHIFEFIKSESKFVKWVDDTHALLILGTLNQAKRALEVNNSVVKVRSMINASPKAKQLARHADLRPAMKRPATNLQTARRLITSHLGAKSNISKEENERERQALREAREQRKLMKQSEQDAWEGRPRTNK